MSDAHAEAIQPALPLCPADLRLDGYDYELPAELIAQNPVVPRDHSRLLAVRGADLAHRVFYELPELLSPGDRLVLNNTQVIPARLYGHKRDPRTGALGAAVEVLLLEEETPDCWQALVRPGRRLGVGSQLVFGRAPGPVVRARILATVPETGGRRIAFELSGGQSLWAVLDQLGQLPLPPYITDSQAAPAQYQTVYAEHPGAVAAPTAGLHFTPELLARLSARHIECSFVTLHVGVGTFRPVEVAEVSQHRMHREWLAVNESTVAEIQQTRQAGGRIIAVGTTAARALEAAAHSGQLQPYRGKTDLFIYPGYCWRVLDGLITNFHLPRSSLLMLVSALIGRERLLALYAEAIRERYRFYSFGDAMLLLPGLGRGG